MFITDFMLFDFEEWYMLWNIQKSDGQTEQKTKQNKTKNKNKIFKSKQTKQNIKNKTKTNKQNLK